MQEKAGKGCNKKTHKNVLSKAYAKKKFYFCKNYAKI